MITAKADKVIIENRNNRLWIVYAKNGIVTHKRKVFKSFHHALNHLSVLKHHYQIENITEINI